MGEFEDAWGDGGQPGDHARDRVFPDDGMDLDGGLYEDYLPGDDGIASDYNIQNETDEGAHPHPDEYNADLEPDVPSTCAAEGIDMPYIWSFVLFLAASLNLRFHVTHRACNLMLMVISTLFIYAGVISSRDRPATTLKTVFKQLSLDDHFLVFPMCPKCRRVYPDDSGSDMKCDSCDLPLFKTKTTLRNDFDGTAELDESQTHEPVLKYPHQTLTSQLKEMLTRQGLEDELDKWKAKQHQPGLLTDITDGSVWKGLKAHDGAFFFDPETDELRIALILLFDG